MDQEDEGEKACLEYNIFKTHLVDSIKKKLLEGNTDVTVIPGGLTSQLQPCDVSINKPFSKTDDVQKKDDVLCFMMFSAALDSDGM